VTSPRRVARCRVRCVRFRFGFSLRHSADNGVEIKRFHEVVPIAPAHALASRWHRYSSSTIRMAAFLAWWGPYGIAQARRRNHSRQEMDRSCNGLWQYADIPFRGLRLRTLERRRAGATAWRPGSGKQEVRLMLLVTSRACCGCLDWGRNSRWPSPGPQGRWRHIGRSRRLPLPQSLHLACAH
jgi:hypothetical protein